MKRSLARLFVALKAVLHLGPSQTFWYAVYQMGLRSGFYKRKSPIQAYPKYLSTLRSPFRLPDSHQIQALLPAGRQRRESLLAEANEIVRGQYRPFGGPFASLTFATAEPKQHWTAYEGRPEAAGVEDLKYIWEPARFGWTYPLGRAYLVSGDERYPAAFWSYFEEFLAGNPPNLGPNWSSAQEVALRLLAMLFAACAFGGSHHTTADRLTRLAGAVSVHANRIPLTLSYACAQNNNHLISEALGMYAAGFALPEHPSAGEWARQGWRWLNRALQSQIEPDGSYVQHSMNYHRLMLEAALQATLMGRAFPPQTHQRLAAAARWLLAQVDPGSGCAPNLGANDGAFILPLASGDFCDYRPAVQSAARAFLGQPAFPPGPWDESGLWLKLESSSEKPIAVLPSSEGVQRLGNPHSWATLRAVRFKSRPSHADQLHVDLWWRGENIALDAGTYRYTAPPPWNNALADTAVHNTVEVSHKNQMTRAGRFLWLDWAQARLIKTKGVQAEVLAAQHDGYRHLGVIHRRILKHTEPNQWDITDHLLLKHTLQFGPSRIPIYPYTLHWLLPDWPWELHNRELILHPPQGGRIRLTLTPSLASHPKSLVEEVSLARAGQALSGPPNVSPLSGWLSRAYGTKEPALSLALIVHSPLPFSISSRWVLEA